MRYNTAAPRDLELLCMKIGRNDVCHCGSGKKYKKCCLDADAESTSVSLQQPFQEADPTSDELERLAVQNTKLGDPEDGESNEYFALRTWIDDYASQLEDGHPFEFDIEDESLDIRARINIAREYGLSEFYEKAEQLHKEWWMAHLSQEFA